MQVGATNLYINRKREELRVPGKWKQYKVVGNMFLLKIPGEVKTFINDTNKNIHN